MSWERENRDHLVACLRRVEELLGAHATGEPSAHARGPAWPEWGDPGRPPAIRALCAAFGLGAFERDVVLLAAGVELQGSFAARCAEAQGDPRLTYPTLGLALAALPGASWDALLPDRPLRRWSLIEVQPDATLVHARLRLDESVWQALLGLRACSPRLARHLRRLPPPAPLAPSQEALARRVAAACAAAPPGPAVVQLVGRSFRDAAAVAARAAAALGSGLEWLPASGLPQDAGEAEQLVGLWERDRRLAPRALLVDAGALDAHDVARASALSRLLAADGLVFLAGKERRALPDRGCLVFDVPGPTPAEQVELWEGALAAVPAETRAPMAAGLAGVFDLDAATIEVAACQGLGVLAEAQRREPARLEASLWEACCAQVRLELEDLALRVPPRATWEDLVLPAATLELLRDLVDQVRLRAHVLDRWGFARTGDAVGTTALFAGPSGTGKTLAAQVLAGALRLDLYRVDLSAVISKYIGETEKNLRRLFDAAERGGAVLLFDEADALFGKRSEVRDSHDRYANVEVSYLLQRLERFRGLGILTTNMKDALDHAFLRRLHHVVDFEFPDPAQREAIWRRAIPDAVPRERLDPAALARLDVSGGSIRMISLNAAYLAAAGDGRLGMAHLARAARRECAKLQKPVGARELEAWR